MSRCSLDPQAAALDADALIAKIVEWSNIARKQGLLGLEPLIERGGGPVRAQGRCSWWSTAASPTQIRAILEVEMDVREHADTPAAKVFEGMGIYAPTLGIIGAVLGLMAVMQNLADPSQARRRASPRRSPRRCTASASPTCSSCRWPASSRASIAEQTQVREMVIEGMMSIALGENPRAIESKLHGFLHD